MVGRTAVSVKLMSKKKNAISQGKHTFFQLTDKQWSSIGMEFPAVEWNEARKKINWVINGYIRGKSLSQEQPNPSELRKTLEKMKTALEYLYEGLSTPTVMHALQDPALIKVSEGAQHSPWAAPKHKLQHENFERMREDMAGYILWISNAEKKITSKKTGQDVADKDWLVSQLDKVLFQHTGKRLSRSYKRQHTKFVSDILKFLGERQGAEKAIRRHVKNRKLLRKKNVA